MNKLGAKYSEAVLIALAFSICTPVCAQGIGGGASVPRNSTVQPVPQNNKVTARVSAWFAKYDLIRRDAQMMPNEKRSAHKLLTAAFGNPQDKLEAQQILSRMTARYDKAVNSLSALPVPPETSSLHKGYLNYFKTGKNFFQRYLQSLKQNTNPLAIDQLQSAKRQMAFMDVSNKLLDKKLRKQYNIAPYRYEW